MTISGSSLTRAFSSPNVTASTPVASAPDTQSLSKSANVESTLEPIALPDGTGNGSRAAALASQDFVKFFMNKWDLGDIGGTYGLCYGRPCYKR